MKQCPKCKNYMRFKMTYGSFMVPHIYHVCEHCGYSTNMNVNAVSDRTTAIQAPMKHTATSYTIPLDPNEPIHLSQSMYDQLSYEEKMNGRVYIIDNFD